MMSYTHRVRYHEVDQQGFLFNGRTLEIADVAMTEFFRALGWTYPELNALGVDPSVVRAEIEYTSPAKFDDELTVETHCLRVGNSSFTLRTSTSCSGRGVATVTLVYVNVSTQTEGAVPLPEEIRSALLRSIPEAGAQQPEAGSDS